MTAPAEPHTPSTRRRNHSQTYERGAVRLPDSSCRTLNADYTYAHTATKRQSVSIVMATWDSESAQMACAVVPPDGTRFYAVSFLLRSFVRPWGRV